MTNEYDMGAVADAQDGATSGAQDAPAAGAEPAATAEPVVGAASGRRRWRVCGDDLSIMDGDAVIHSFDLSRLPPEATLHARSLGVSVILGRQKPEDVVSTFEKMVAGDIPRQREKVLRLDNWRLAIAQAASIATRKTYAPIDLEAAKERAAKLTADQVRVRKTDPAVVKQYNAIIGAKATPIFELLG